MSVRICEDSDLTSLSPRVEETCLLEASLYRGCKSYHVMLDSHDRQPSLSGAVEDAKLRFAWSISAQREKVLECCS